MSEQQRLERQADVLLSRLGELQTAHEDYLSTLELYEAITHEITHA